MVTPSTVVLLVYGAVTVLLGATGLYYGLLAAERIVRDGEPPAVDGAFDEHPSVTVQVPVYNERNVVGRVLDAVGALRWPADRLQVQVIDDSTDDTSTVVAEELAALRERGVDVEHIRRPERDGYKAGAVERGLETATGAFVALFDADFVPPPDFLAETIPHFREPEVGCVQTRWTHLNEELSWFTRAQALALDAHFAVEQWVRAQVGSLLSFNATSCVWRRETIEAVGGWSSETVAEDLDLTAAALRDGWRFVYTEGYAVPCEIPPSLSGFVRQQTRWARGSTQNVRKHLRGLLASEQLGRWATFHSVLHVLHYAFYPLLLAWLALHLLVIGVTTAPRWLLATGFLMVTPGPVVFLALGQRFTGRAGRLRRLIVGVVGLSLVGVGIAWRMSRAVVSGFVEMGGAFARTPKFGVTGPRRSWRDRAYASGLSRTHAEALLGLCCAAGAVSAVALGAHRMAPSLALFALSFWTIVAYDRWQR
jgi:cellulose synthase/poly-beta-1,6-N-acetylglucosamine synthase-like glycosyltransferase